MIYSLGQPVFFAGLVLGFVVGCFVHVGAQRWAILHLGGAQSRWLLPAHQGAARYLDPFGAVAALLGGVGWGTPVESASYRRTGRARTVALMLVGPLANAVLSIACLALLAQTGGFGVLAQSVTVGDLLHGHLGLGSAGPTLLAAAAIMNMSMAILSLIPLPPLEGGRILFLFTPRTLGWQKAEYYLVERNIGIAILLIGLILSFSARPAPIAYVVGTISQPIIQALLQVFGA